MPRPIRTRQFFNENVWMKQSDGSYIFAWRPPTTDIVDIGAIDIVHNNERQMVTAKTRGYLIIASLGDRSSQITWMQQTSLKGKIPNKIMEAAMPRSLRPIFLVRERFNRDEEVDRIEREKLMEIMTKRSEEEEYVARPFEHPQGQPLGIFESHALR